MTTKKTVKKSTKKPSAKQIAARKKFAAAAKARAKKTAPKTRKTTTGKRVRTEAAKKARRAKNTVEGYYPNPVNDLYYIYFVFNKDKKDKYYATRFLNTGGRVEFNDTPKDKTGAIKVHKDLALALAEKVQKASPSGLWGVGIEKVKK